MVTSLGFPVYEVQPHHRDAAVFAAARGIQLDMDAVRIPAYPRGSPAVQIVVDFPRRLVGVPVNDLTRRAHDLFKVVLDRAFAVYRPRHINVEADTRYELVSRVFSTSYIRSLFGNLIDPTVTIVRSEAFEAHLAQLDARTRSQLLEDVYADVFMVSVGRFEEKYPRVARRWLHKLVLPLFDYIFDADLDTNLPQWSGTFQLSRPHSHPVSVDPPISVPSDFDFPASPPPTTFDVQYFGPAGHLVSIAIPSQRPPNLDPPVAPSAPQHIELSSTGPTIGQKRDRLPPSGSTDECARSSKRSRVEPAMPSQASARQSTHPSTARPSPENQTTRRTVVASVKSAFQKAPGPSQSSRPHPPSRMPNRDAFPSSTLVDSAQPILVTERQADTARGQVSLPNVRSVNFSEPHTLRAVGDTTQDTQGSLASQGLPASTSSSSGNMISPSSSSFSLKAVLKQGKSKIAASTSFSRLSELASSFVSKGRHRPSDTESQLAPKASSSQNTRSPPVPQMSSLVRTESQLEAARPPLVSRQPPSAMKRSVSKMDVEAEAEAEKRASSNPLKRLKIMKKKSDHVSPTLP